MSGPAREHDAFTRLCGMMETPTGRRGAVVVAWIMSAGGLAGAFAAIWFL